MTIVVLGQNYIGLNPDGYFVNGNPYVPLYHMQGNSFFPFKNRIINGEFNVNQRNNGLTVNNAAAKTFPFDRWGTEGGTSGAFSVKIATDDVPGDHFLISKQLASLSQASLRYLPPSRRFANVLEIKSLSNLSISANHAYEVFQNIEGRHIMDMDFGNSGTGNSSGLSRYFILSFFMKTSIAGSYTIRFEQPGGGSVLKFFAQVNTTANEWRRYSIPVPIPTSGTWNINNSTGLRVVWVVGAGASTITTTGMSWHTSSLTALNLGTNLVSTLNATMKLTGIQLEYIGNLPNPAPTYPWPSDFQTRSWQTEYELCLRYYQKSYVYGTNAWTSTTEGMYINSNNSAETTVPTYNHIRWPGGPMRATPTVTLYGLNSATAGRAYIWNGSVGGLGDEAAYATAISATAAMFYITPVTLGNHFMTGFNWVADAEP